MFNSAPPAGYTRRVFLFKISEDKPADDQGWCEVTVQFDNFFKARESILSFGWAAEVVEPEALKASVIDHARQIVDFYGEIKVAQ